MAAGSAAARRGNRIARRGSGRRRISRSWRPGTWRRCWGGGRRASSGWQVGGGGIGTPGGGGGGVVSPGPGGRGTGGGGGWDGGATLSVRQVTGSNGKVMADFFHTQELIAGFEPAFMPGVFERASPTSS